MPVFKIKVNNGLDQFRRQARYMLDDMIRMSEPFAMNRTGWIPAVDLYENSSVIYLVADAAGIDRDSLSITIDGGLLRLAGRRRTPVDMEGKYYHIMEIEYGSFERIVRLPHDTDFDGIEARYEDGLLIVSMPKKKRPPVRIDIQKS